MGSNDGNLLTVSKLKHVAKVFFSIYRRLRKSSVWPSAIRFQTCWNLVDQRKGLIWLKKSNVEKSKYSRHFRFIQHIDKLTGAWWTERTKNPTSLMVLAAVGVGARNLLCIFVETRKPSIARCSRKFWNQKLLLELCLGLPHTNISTVFLITGWLFWSLGNRTHCYPDPNVLVFNFFTQIQDEVHGRYSERSI